MVKDGVRQKIKTVYKSLVRVRALGWIAGAAFAVLLARVFYLQAVRGDFYKRMAESNCVSVARNMAPRGNIYDRNYTPLVVNVPSYTLSIIPFHFAQNSDTEKCVKELADVLGIKEGDIAARLASTREYVLAPVLIRKDLTLKQISVLTEMSIQINGLYLSQEPKREYPFKSLASHVLGYVGEVTEQQLKYRAYADYVPGDIIGQTGVEKFYDRTLRGKDGVMYILTDAQGRQKKVLNEAQPRPGKNIVLTIDYRIQKFAEQVMDRNGYNGVVIVSDPRNGEVLAMVSKPGYDLSYFSGGIDLKEWKKLTRNPDRPLTDRAVQGLYSPGSIFKVAVGVGALNEGVVDLNTAFYCEGIYWIKTWPYKCWRREGHGWENFFDAVAHSCDIYFYKTGLRMTVEMLHKYGVMFGLSELTGIDLPGEKRGVVPTREWKRKISRTPWFPGNTVMMSIGQGYITATPFQIMNMVEAVANGGFAMTPHVLRAVTDDGRRIQKKYEPKKLFELNTSKFSIDMMKKGMKMAVSSPSGTAAKARLRVIQVAGKTATVENPHGENHAMFCGYAKADEKEPEIIVYVLVEHGGGGGDKAAPVAHDVLEHYYKYVKVQQ